MRSAPGAVGPLLRRAGVLRRWRDHDRAAVAYRSIVAAAPDLAAAQAGLAQVMIAQGQAPEAMALLVQAQARLGPQADIRGVLALARVVTGDLRDLGQADFREADLPQLDLSRQVLRGADFSRAFLGSVRLEQSDLRGARFDGTRFYAVDLRRADLRGAQFVAPLGFPRVEGADLREARLERIDLPEDWSLRDIDMRGATLLESRFRAVSFVAVDLRGARLTTIHMRRGGFVASRLDGAVLRDVTFSRVDMTAASGVPPRILAAPGDLPGVRLINVRFEE
nr:pentapeptide repeat-containing protein [Neoroseomonas alba]